MKLSVIIVSFNTQKLTENAIGSVLEEDSVFPIEIILVDNGSKDGSVEMLKKLEVRNKNVKAIFNKGNLGFAKANNQAIKKAKSQYILLLNSDTIVSKGALGKLVEFAQSHVDAGVVGARLLNADGSFQASCFHFPTIWRAIWEYWFGQKGHFEQFVPRGLKASNVDAVVGAAFLITPLALKTVGLLNERYFFYFEDIDYCRRIRKSGLKVYYLPGAEIIHLGGASGKSLADTENQWRRLIPSSKIYHGVFMHYLIVGVMWLGQKWQKFLTNPK